MNADIIARTDKDKLTNIIDQESKAGDVGLHMLRKLARWQDTVAVKECTQPRVWRLMEKDDSGKVTDDEMVFTIYGRIQVHNLLPFNKKDLYMRDIQRAKYLKQTISIDGLGGDEMKDSQYAMQSIHGLFDRSFKQGQLEALYHDDDTTIISAANRVLTPSRDLDPNEAHLPFDSNCDPDGLLESIARQGFKRTEDNLVNYVKAERKVDGSNRYAKTIPQTFRDGDLVSIQVSFVVVPMKRGKYRMLTVLRSMTLLEATIVQFAHTKAKEEGKSTSVIKRKVRTGIEAEDSEVDGLPRKIWRGITAMDIVEERV